MASPFIIIDPGHGGFDPGAVSGGVQEKDITLKVSKQLQGLLQQAGFRVLLTRETDQALGPNVPADLNKRVAVCNSNKPDFILSVHVNAGGGTGAEIYVYDDGGSIRPLAQKMVENVSTLVGYHGKPVKSSTETPQGGLAMVDNTHAPAALIELFFIDSSDRQKAMASIDLFAEQMAQALCEFYNLPYPNRQTQTTLAPQAPYDHARVLAQGVANRGLISDPDLWEKVLKGQIQPDRQWIQVLFENIVKKV